MNRATELFETKDITQIFAAESRVFSYCLFTITQKFNHIEAVCVWVTDQIILKSMKAGRKRTYCRNDSLKKA